MEKQLWQGDIWTVNTEFARNIPEFQSGQSYPLLIEFSKDLETLAPVMAKVTLWWAVVLNYAAVSGREGTSVPYRQCHKPCNGPLG